MKTKNVSKRFSKLKENWKKLKWNLKGARRLLSLTFLIPFLLVFSLSSCSEAKKLKRAERKIEKLTRLHPQLLQIDTVKDTFSIVLPKVSYDTFFVDVPGDTTTITYNKYSVRHVRIGDTTYIAAQYKGDTIREVVEIPVEKIVIKKEPLIDQLLRYTRGGVLWIIILLVLLGVIRLAWKFIKPF